MCRLIQFILIAAFLIVLAPAQASLNFDTGLSTCKFLPAEASEGDKKKDPDKENSEEEPDCD